MCGIAGAITAKTVLPNQVRDLLDALKERGPDAEGAIAIDSGESKDPRTHRTDAGTVILLHRRLSIIDLSAAANQPMWNNSRTLCVVFNGEIYNYRELRTELQSRGCRFSTSSDTEVLLEAWSEWGPACLPRLIGMFAFALWDTSLGTLHLARDRFGIKPLYYTSTDTGFWFSSTPGSMVLSGIAAFRPDQPALAEFLSGGNSDHGDRTFFQGIRQLPAGHCATIHAPDKIEIKNWADRTRSTIGAEEKLADVLTESVQLHLRSDVPVAVALSGGVDSHGITCITAQSGHRPHVFSYASGDHADESAVARNTAERLRLPFTKVTSDRFDFKLLRKVVAAQEEPFGTLSIMAQFALYEAVQKQGLRVILDGQGADELFGGYESHRIHRITDLVLRFRWLTALRCLRLARTNTQTTNTMPRLVWQRIKGRLFRMRPRASLVPPWWHGLPVTTPRLPAGSLRVELRNERKKTSLPALLRYQDRNSMAFSVESRVPYLVESLESVSESLPDRLIVDDTGLTKAALRNALHGIVPATILSERRKIGFQAPEEEFMRRHGAEIRAEFAEPPGSLREFIDAEQLTSAWQECCRGQQPCDWRFFRTLTVILWARFFDAQTRSTKI